MLLKKVTGLLHSKGRITKKTVAANVTSEEIAAFSSRFSYKSRRQSAAPRLFLAALLKFLWQRLAAESLGLDLSASISERIRKNV